MTDAPSSADTNISAVDNNGSGPVFNRFEVRIRCIEKTELSRNAPQTGFPVPYSVALAAECASFAASEPTHCEFTNHIPATHRCGVKSVASVASFTRGHLRACRHHADASHAFGLVVVYDAGYVVAE